MKIMAFFAHPDDETVFLGGTFAYLADKGAEIHYVCATRGEGGEVGEPPVCTREELGQVRENELRCAVESLGGASLQFSGYRDPEIGSNGELYAFTDDEEKAAAEFKDKLITINPQVILTHGEAGEYGHPAHIQVYRVMDRALADVADYSPAVFSPGYFSGKVDRFIPPPEILLDISPWKEQKIKAACCHRSQHDLFIRNGSARAGRLVTIPEMIRPIEALCRIKSPGIDKKDEYFLDLLSEISIPLSSIRE